METARELPGLADASVHQQGHPEGIPVTNNVDLPHWAFKTWFL